MDLTAELFGGRHQTVVLSNRLSTASAMASVGVFGMSSNAYLRDRSCVFEQPLSPSSQLLNEALEPMDDEETLRMNEEPSNNVEEPLNNVAHNIYTHELPTLNLLNSAQSIPEEYFISPQSEGGHASQHNSMNVDQYSHFDTLAVESQCETPSADDLERNVSPFAAEMSPKTYQEVVKSVKEDIYPPLQGLNQVSSPMDGSQSFVEYLSHGSHVTTPHGSNYISTESQGEQLQLTTSAPVINPAPSPMIVQSPMTPMTPNTPGIQTPSTPGVQCSEVEQTLSDGPEVNVYFNSHKSASLCRNWYGALLQVVPEIVKPQQGTRKEHILMKLPDEAIPLVTWCTFNRSGKIRARIIQELARIIKDLHQNKIAKGLCFFGGLTLSESVFVNVDPSTGEPQLYIVPNLVAFWQFASIHNDKDPNTPRLGRLQDVRQFVKILEYTIMKPVKHKEFMVSYALYSACKYCVGEGTEGDKMPLFYQRLAGHQLACIQLSQENVTYDVVCYSHEILESCLTKLTHWRVVKPSAVTNPNTVNFISTHSTFNLKRKDTCLEGVTSTIKSKADKIQAAQVYGLYCSGRMMLCSEELASLNLTIHMRQLPVEKVRRMTGNPLLLALK